MLWRWIKRKHPKKSATWSRKKYFSANGTRNWVFTGAVLGKHEERKSVTLCKAADTPIKRHLKIRGEANPYDPQWEVYFEERLGLQMVDTPQGYRRLVHLWFGQEGSGAVCAQKITRQSGWATGRLVRQTSENKRKANLVLLHPACHRRVRPPTVSSHRVPQEGTFRKA